MKVSFVADAGNADGTIGGAELTMREFAAAAPEGVELVEDAETVVVGNCVSSGLDLLDRLKQCKRVIRYHHDLARHEHPELRAWLEQHALNIFTSPLHRERYGLDGEVNPPAVDLAAFRPSRQIKRNGHRKGAVAIAPWQNPGKGQQLLREWADQNEPVDVYGGGPFTPHGPNLSVCGPLPPEQVASTLWKYERFIHLPTEPEPFGRAVVEAWAAGCGLVINRLVGARYFIESAPQALELAAESFWRLVLSDCENGVHTKRPRTVGAAGGMTQGDAP